MNWRRQWSGGFIALVGFLLSPLSWWNDLFVNVPLAVGLAWLAAWVHPPAFQPALVFAYWLTNVLGLVLMHLGVRRMATPDRKAARSRRELFTTLAVSAAYTVLIVALARWGILKPLDGYFSNR